MAEKILITGGAGYIGSHAAVELMSAGFEVVIVDNLCNSSVKVLDRLITLCGPNFSFVEADVRDSAAMDAVFAANEINGVIHFAGLKAVGESMEQPLRYFDNNVGSTLTLLGCMNRAGVRRIVFSSSATVYGDPDEVPIRESAPLRVTNPYGRTKLMCEDILRELHATDASWRVAILRYFNPVGAHESGLIGEHPNGNPNNLMQFISQVALGKRELLKIFGNDYLTVDGTGVRDYIHVVDLARGHLAALKYIESSHRSITVNLGTGRGVSVRELADTFARVNQVVVPYAFVPRRAGDVGTSYADITLSTQELGWTAEYDLVQICRDIWRWQSANPEGYV